MNRSSRRGSAFLDLIIVLFLIGFLVAIAMPQVNSLTEDAKKTKAKQDCDTLCQAIQKYQALEGVAITSLLDLKGKYLTNIDTLKDSWGNSYRIDLDRGCVYSMGPDGLDSETGGGTDSNRDNIRVSWTGPLQLLGATYEIHPGAHEAGDEQYSRGILHLYFNKKVKLARNRIDFKNLFLPEQRPEVVPAEMAKSRQPDPACPDFAIRLFREARGESAGPAGPAAETAGGVDPPREMVQYGPVMQVLDDRDPWGHCYNRNLRTGVLFSAGPDTMINLLDPSDPCNRDNICFQPRTEDSAPLAVENAVLPASDEYRWPGHLPDSLIHQTANPDWTPDGAIFHTDDSLEIVIVLPAGRAGEIIPGRNCLNLTGNRFNRAENVNPLFREFDGLTPAAAGEKSIPLKWKLPPVKQQLAHRRKGN